MLIKEVAKFKELEVELELGLTFVLVDGVVVLPWPPVLVSGVDGVEGLVVGVGVGLFEGSRAAPNSWLFFATQSRVSPQGTVFVHRILKSGQSNDPSNPSTVTLPPWEGHITDLEPTFTE